MGAVRRSSRPTQYGAGEIVMYRSAGRRRADGAAAASLAAPARAAPCRAMHLLAQRRRRGRAVPVVRTRIGGLPLATAMTLNYMSSVWMALFLVGGARWRGGQPRVDGRLVAAVLAGFAGVALILRPTIDSQQQVWHGLAGLLSGVLSAVALPAGDARSGRAGEPEQRVVFYFSLGGVVGRRARWRWPAAASARTTLRGLALLLAIGLLAHGGAADDDARLRASAARWRNAALQYLGIVFSFGFGVWLFDDPVTPSAMAGMALIVAAGVAATLAAAAAAHAGCLLTD
ncbi:MAG: DMT family transporter [Comamonadaceae bacterium]|nr:DMT family transporter [Comamonadaceae bacterium]